jgi:hypothetical protein
MSFLSLKTPRFEDFENPRREGEKGVMSDSMTNPAEFEKFWGCLSQVARDDAWLIPIVAEGKEPAIPRGESWQNEKYRLTPEAAEKRLENGGNVGITFRGKGAVFDIDHIEKAKVYFCAGMIETLIVRTRDKKLHIYYLNDGTIENGDLNLDGVHILEIRTKWRYVVCPGSHVPPTPGSGGDGCYKVVNERPPLLIGRGDLPWLNVPEVKTNYAPVDFEGRYLSLPCLKLFFEIPLKDGRATRAAKLLATAAVMDGIGTAELRDIDKRFTTFQNNAGRKRLPSGGVERWAANIRKTGKKWNCGEMVNYLRFLEIFPCCSGCPMRKAK